MLKPEIGNDNGEIVGFSINGGSSGVKLAKKSRKLKNKKLAKSKKLLKSRNQSNFGIMEARSSFLTSNAIISFNCL